MAISFLWDVQAWYAGFDAPVVPFDCGPKCAPHNPSGKPFCCDICFAIPAVYHIEWAYLREHTDLWHIWRGNECSEKPEDPARLQAETPDSMLLLACRGAEHCQRQYRALGCRQFPFFPYIGSDLRFLGLAYEWAFESSCWVISNLGWVTQAFRQEFIHIFDQLLNQWPAELEAYAIHSENLREHFASQRRRIPLLHRNGLNYLISPASERLQRVEANQLPKFGPYKESTRRGEP
ncbi:MAG: hypothetical protein JW726_20015 [Anaerolineales bacterium]|nr:hypothetical protein [Anaerolineales bacterium]